MKPFYRRTLKLSRYCHLYITLFTLTLILFFAATGFMLNHEDWFLPENPRETKFEGEIPLKLVALPPATAEESTDDAVPQVDKFEVCEALRKAFGINGVVHENSFRCDRDTVEVVFGGPGGKTTAEVARDTGKVKITKETNGFAGIITDLHKGKSTGSIWKAGTGWSLLIDAVCIALFLISVTGLVLWSSLKSRGKWGAVLLLAGTGIALGLYFVTVPR
jgi:hypothetical protein